MTPALEFDPSRRARVLAEARRRERAQTRFYRHLAAEADLSGESALAERFNELHADEQHHLSRITARMLELELDPGGGAEEEVQAAPTLEGWLEVAREREKAEVRWYEEALSEPLDPETRRVLEEILESERHHRRDVGGKWMPA